jgi:hypothetical protein
MGDILAPYSSSGISKGGVSPTLSFTCIYMLQRGSMRLITVRYLYIFMKNSIYFI